MGNNLWQLVIQCLLFLLIGVFNYQDYSFPNPKLAGLWGITSVLIGWVLVSALFLLVASSQVAQQSSPDDGEYSAGQVSGQLIVALIQLGPVLAIMRWRREPLASARVSVNNLGRSLLVGVLLSMFSLLGVVFSGNRNLSEVLAGLTSSHFWALINYAIVGFCEEFVFRGYLQTRMIAWLGRWQGWIVTSVLMALAHIVQRVTMMEMLSLEALVSSVILIPISLLMGYVMFRTQNVIAPGLFHTFANWVNTLG
jgi:membrane protease YdiL (CAAX protease family)